MPLPPGNDNGYYSYNPNGLFNALADGPTVLHSLSYTSSDCNAGSDGPTVTHTIPTRRSSDLAVADVGTTNEDTILNVAAAGVLGNDTDPDTGDVLGVAAVNGRARDGSPAT